MSSLQRVVDGALRSRQAVIKSRNSTIDETGEPLDALACPLFLDGQLKGVVAFALSNRSPSVQQSTVQHIQIGLKWLETMFLVHSSSANDQLITLLELLSAGLEHDNFLIALTQVTTELADRFNCKRASIGFLEYGRLRIEAISHSQKIDRHSSLVHGLRDAMVEAIDQGSSISFPLANPETVQATHFHQLLAKQLPNTAFSTVPLIKNSEAVGAVLFEREQRDSFDQETVTRLEQICMLLGPALESRRRDEQALGWKILDSIYDWLKKLIGPGHLPFKVAAGLAASLLFLLSFASGQFCISTDSVLEASICRVIVAPQDGYIETSEVRPGDLVRKGELLGSLDDRELRKEKRKWLSKHDQLVKEYRQALAGFDRTEAAVLNAKHQQIKAQLELVEQKLLRTRLIAPFTGVIVKGDLSQSLGTPVERGEVLFEVAPTDEYRVVMKVDDRDIGMIATGQPAKLRLASLPGQLIDIKVDRITPMAMVEDQRNVFRVEGVMQQGSDMLRPGMKGVSRIEVGERKLIWIWTRRLLGHLRMLTWNWLP